MDNNELSFINPITLEEMKKFDHARSKQGSENKSGGGTRFLWEQIFLDIFNLIIQS